MPFRLTAKCGQPQLDVLANRFRVIAPDVRGFGESQPASPWTMEEAADDMIGLLDHIEATDAAVVGVSMGGYIELALWQKYPSRIRRLVLSNSRARADSEHGKSGTQRDDRRHPPQRHDRSAGPHAASPAPAEFAARCRRHRPPNDR
jgi:pimeloyl-ACP methyl ester carboxylesterase